MTSTDVKASRRGDMATQILDVAEALVQTRGFNAFSYADVANELGCTKAALHYHFAGKSELGEALLTRYTERFVGSLALIEAASQDGPTRLSAYADLYLDVLRHKRMCLCGILAAEYATLPETMQGVVRRFFDANEAWLTRILTQGKQAAHAELLRLAPGDGARHRQQPRRSRAHRSAVRRPRHDSAPPPTI